MSDDLPQAVAEETMEIMGIKLRVAVLDNGQRVIFAEDFDKLIALIDADSEE